MCLADDQITINARFEASKTSIRKVCLLAPEATLTRIGMKGGEAMVQETAEWTAKLNEMVRGAFVDRGVVIVADYYSDSVKGPVSEAMVQIRRKYDTISSQMRKKQEDVRPGRYSLGDEVALLPCTKQADTLAFITATGVLQTQSNKVSAVITGGILGFAAVRSDLWLCLVNANSGDVDGLGHLELIGKDTFAIDPEEVYGKHLRRQMAKMHVGQ